MNKHYDLIVVGGGFAGTMAAMEAARHGKSVLLVEKYNCLGGAAMNCLVMPFMNFWTHDPQTGEQQFLTGDLFLQVVEELRKLGGMDDTRIFHEEPLKLVLNRLCLRYGVELLFNTVVVDAKVEEGEIKSLQAGGLDRMIPKKAIYTIDATGDA